jgi:hypothetical protein
VNGPIDFNMITFDCILDFLLTHPIKKKHISLKQHKDYKSYGSAATKGNVFHTTNSVFTVSYKYHTFLSFSIDFRIGCDLRN